MVRRRLTSEHLGVCWDKRVGKWVAQIRRGGKNHVLGHYDNEEDAAYQYEVAADDYEFLCQIKDEPEMQDDKIIQRELARWGIK